MPRMSPWREDPVELDPGAPVLASSGAAPPWELLLRRAAPPPMRLFSLSRPIGNRRTRLDRLTSLILATRSISDG